MARPRSRTESPVSFGRTAPVVTDRINQLQIAVSNHKQRERPLFGGEPLVLPKSTKNQELRRRRERHSWSTESDNIVRWSNVSGWCEKKDELPVAALQDENKPFDPFRLGAAATTSESIDEKIDEYLRKAAIYDKKRKENKRTGRVLRGTTPPAGRSPLTSCLSPNKNNHSRSVAFDLVESQSDIKQIHEERRERRHRLYEKKVYVSKHNQGDSSANVETPQFSPPAYEDGEEQRDDSEDFFDVLVAKSSSSSHGATQWFENLLEESKSPTESVQINKIDDQATFPLFMPSQQMEREAFGSWANVDGSRSNFIPKTTSASLVGQASARENANYMQNTASTSRQDKQKSTPTKRVVTRREDNKKLKNFVLETVRSTSSGESDASPCQHQFSPRSKPNTNRHESPNWRSQGKSRTDHLLRSIGMEENSKTKRFDAFGLRRDPEARRCTQKDPEGILGNQLTQSSSEESGSTKKESSRLKKTSDGAPESTSSHPISVIGITTNSEKSFKNGTQQLSPKGRALFDIDVSKSVSSSTKSTAQTGPQQLPQDEPVCENRESRNLSSKKRLKTDDDSSVFSNLPSGSLAQSMQIPDTSSCRCLPDYAMKEAITRNVYNNLDDCTRVSGTKSDAAVLHVFPSKRLAAAPVLDGSKNELCKEALNENRCEQSNSMIFGNNHCPDLTPSTLRNEENFETRSPLTSDYESPRQARVFWKSLASFKTLGSFDSDSIVKESSGRRTKQAAHPFIDRNPVVADEDDPILSLRSPMPEVEVKQPIRTPEKGIPVSNDGPKMPPDSLPDRRDLNEKKELKSPTEIKRRSNARYLSSAAIPPEPPITPGEQRLHHSSVWMTQKVVPQQKATKQVRREMPKQVEESVMYLMGPLMSGDTEEDVTTVLTDDFKSQEERASEAAQRSCYSCGSGLDLTNWGWFTK